jgi:hypothetical protein
MVHASTDVSDNAATFVTARELQTDVNSSQAHQQITCWLDECSSHDCYIQRSESILPTRVVEVAPSDCPDMPRILVTGGKVVNMQLFRIAGALNQQSC